MILPVSLGALLNDKTVYRLCEIRIFADRPLRFFYCDRVLCVKQGYGFCSEKESDGYMIGKDEVTEIFYRACKMSVYAYSEEIKRGFITLESGIRMGLCGQAVYEESGRISHISNLTSLVLRIPCDVENAADTAISVILKSFGKLRNVLIFSPPSMGKTTMLRSFARYLSEKLKMNVVVIDERNELNGLGSLSECNVMKYFTKPYAIECAIRSLSPQYIICDELMGKDDFESILNASKLGVNVICSIHAEYIGDIAKNRNFLLLKKDRLFDAFVGIGGDGIRRGVVTGVYDAEMTAVYP